MDQNNVKGGQKNRTQKFLLPGLLGGCVVLMITAVTMANMYYQATRLNQVLRNERCLKPEKPIANPPTVVVAASIQSGTPSVPSTDTPPVNLAEGAELIVVSGYQAGGQALNGTVVRVVIDRPGKSVLLVLTSYDRVAWHVDATSTTRIQGIVISGYKQTRLYTAVDAPVFQSKLPYAYEVNSANFVDLLGGLNKLFGVDRIDAFRGKSSLPHSVIIDQLDPPHSSLTLQGEQTQKPPRVFGFQLPTKDHGITRWTLDGPVSNAAHAELVFGKSVKASADQRIYRIVSHDFEVYDPATGEQKALELPDNFPRLTWPSDVAYDSKRHYVALASALGLYRFDVNTRQWLDFRPWRHIDIDSIVYDESTDRYIAWTRSGSITVLAGDGTPLSSRPLVDRLPGYGRLYDTGNGPQPKLKIVARGDQIALILPRGKTVGHIWYYDVKLDVVQLTYQTGLQVMGR